MRPLRKSFIVIVLLTVMLLTTACIPTDEAKTQVSELLSCLGDGDYEKATSYMHPDFAIASELMQSTAEEYLKLGADLSLGIEKISYNSIESSYYDSSVDGKRLILGGRVTLKDGTRFDITFEFIDNDGGYGISQFSASSFSK